MHRRFFIHPENISGNIGIITGADADHIRKSLRLKPGDRITLFSGSGIEYEAVINDISTSKEILVRIINQNICKADPCFELVVAIGMLKKKKMESIIPFLTELGMTTLVPLISERIVAVPKPGRIDKKIERWRSITVSSVKQCGRTRIPVIRYPVSLHEFLAQITPEDLALFFWEEAETTMDIERVKAPPGGRIIVITGPEGGFSKHEAEVAKTAGCRLLSLGPRILRAETAAITACVCAQLIWGDLSCNTAS